MRLRLAILGQALHELRRHAPLLVLTAVAVTIMAPELFAADGSCFSQWCDGCDGIIGHALWCTTLPIWPLSCIAHPGVWCWGGVLD